MAPYVIKPNSSESRPGHKRQPGCNPFFWFLRRSADLEYPKKAQTKNVELKDLLEGEAQRRNEIDEIRRSGQEPNQEKLSRCIFTRENAIQMFSRKIPKTVQKNKGLDIKSVPEWLANLTGEFLIEAYRKKIPLTEVVIGICDDGSAEEFIKEKCREKNADIRIANWFVYSSSDQPEYGKPQPPKDCVSPSSELAEFIYYAAKGYWQDITLQIGREKPRY